MKLFLLLGLTLLTACSMQAQPVTSLPPGKYETKTRTAKSDWKLGDIILLDDGKYLVTTNNEAGTYKFSVAAQRLIFTAGPLKNAFTRVAAVNGKPVIHFPAAENSSLGLTNELVASKQ